MKPFSAMYYLRENKTKATIGILMIFLTVGLYILGNVMESGPRSFWKEFVYSEQFVLVDVTAADTDFKDYYEFLDIVRQDPLLHVVLRTCRGYGSMEHMTAMGLKMGGASYVFQSVEDMKAVFDHLGIACDYTNVKNGSIVISETFAKNRGIRLGDTLDHSFDSALNRNHTVDALIDDGSYTTFYVIEDDQDMLLRMYLYSDTLTGDALYDHVQALVGERKLHISERFSEMVAQQFQMFYAIFYGVAFLISIIMAVTVNSVVTGQYLKRMNEFGIYRALGIRRGEIIGKCAGEILSMDLIAVVSGMAVALLISYLMNELWFLPRGMCLPYYSKVAMGSYGMCNLLIVIPLVASKGRMCAKASIV